MPTILSRLSILFINCMSSDLDNTKILSFKLFLRYLVVKICMCKRGIKSKLMQYLIAKKDYIIFVTYYLLIRLFSIATGRRVANPPPFSILFAAAGIHGFFKSFLICVQFTIITYFLLK